MYEEEEELCPVCDSTCTCYHQPKERGSARANGYRPKAGVARRADGLRAPLNSSTTIPPITSIKPSSSEPTSTSASPLKIRLILGRKSGGGDPSVLPRDQTRRLASPSSSPPLRRKRSPAYSYESSSDSSSAESRINGSSSRESSSLQRTSNHASMASISHSSRSGANATSTNGAGPSKPHAPGGRPPSSEAWHFGTPSSKSELHRNGASRKPTGTRAAGFPTSQLGVASSSSKREKGSKSSALTKNKKANSKPGPKGGSSGGRQVKASPKKRRKLGSTPSPPPRKFGRASTSESEIDDYGSQHSITWDSASRRGRKLEPPSPSGVVLGRPVGVVIPTFVSKPFSSSSSSSQGRSDEDNALDDDMDEDLRKEEERMILREERRREKMRRNHSRQGQGEKVHKRPKQQPAADAFMGSDLTSLSSSADHSAGSSSCCSESSDGNEEDDEGDDGLEEDQDLEFEPDNPGWVNSDPEDDTDADLFFANFLSGGEDDDEGENETPQTTRMAAKVHDELKDQQQNPMADHGFGINEGEIFVAADAFDQFQSQLPSSTGKSKHHRKARKVEQPLVVAENSDGHLVFADGWGSSHGDIVNAEWDAAILMHDEDVTSEESEPNIDLGEEEDGPSTETDFDGDTTVDEGLDEDGLPPAMAAQSQQRQSEREWLLKEMELDVTFPVPENLPVGAEAFQGVYFGRSEFPAVKLDTSVPSITDNAPEVTTEDWQGILQREEVSPKSYFPEVGRSTLGSPLAMLPPALQADQFTALGLSTMPLPVSAPSDQHPSTNEASGLTGNEETSISPEAPPAKKLPLMGTFAPSPPVQDHPLEASQLAFPAPATGNSPESMPPPPSTPKNSTTPKARRIQSKPQSCLLPLAQKGMAVLDGKKTMTVPSPFAGVKRRKKRRVVEESDGSLSLSQSSDHAVLRNGATSGMEQGGSRSGRSSFSTPYTPLGQGRKFLLQQSSIDSLFPPQILPSVPMPMDLSDVLDYAILDGSGSDNDESHDEPDQVGAAIRNLTRWQHVPMGTFRHARAFGSVGTDAELVGMPGRPRRPSVSDGFSYGATPRPPAAVSASALWSDIVDVKGKGKAKEVQDLSPSKKRKKGKKDASIAPIATVTEADEMEVDVIPIPGVGEEEVYFSRKHHKGGREGTERLRMKRKFGEKERKNGVIGSGPRTSPLHDRIKASATAAVESVAGPSHKEAIASHA